MTHSCIIRFIFIMLQKCMQSECVMPAAQKQSHTLTDIKHVNDSKVHTLYAVYRLNNNQKNTNIK